MFFLTQASIWNFCCIFYLNIIYEYTLCIHQYRSKNVCQSSITQVKWFPGSLNILTWMPLTKIERSEPDVDMVNCSEWLCQIDILQDDSSIVAFLHTTFYSTLATQRPFNKLKNLNGPMMPMLNLLNVCSYNKGPRVEHWVLMKFRIITKPCLQSVSIKTDVSIFIYLYHNAVLQNCQTVLQAVIVLNVAHYSEKAYSS